MYRARDGDEAWVSPFALALQQGHVIYMVGSLFVGIAYQPFIFMMLSLQIGLDTYLTRKRKLAARRSEEHTSELQSLMRISYAVFCLKKKNINTNHKNKHT